MSQTRSWLSAGAAAIITGSVMGILVVPAATFAGTGPMPAAVLNLPASRTPSPTTPATPASPQGAPDPIALGGTPAPVPPGGWPTAVAARAATGDPVSNRVSPTGLAIPSLDMDLPVVGVGVRPDGLMEVPDDPRLGGWYHHGAAPSDPAGATVIAAHVDSRRFGIGPFAELTRLRPGDDIVIRTENGEVLYKVTGLQVIGKDALPVDAVFDRSGDRRLHLVTCAGEFSSRTGWDSNLVVIASPV